MSRQRMAICVEMSSMVVILYYILARARREVRGVCALGPAELFQLRAAAEGLSALLEVVQYEHIGRAARPRLEGLVRVREAPGVVFAPAMASGMEAILRASIRVRDFPRFSQIVRHPDFTSVSL